MTSDLLTSDCIADLFELQRPWLAVQPRMNDWQNGCAMIVNQLKRWLDEYSQSICRQEIEAAEQAAYVRRMWVCWSHHWKQAAESVGRIDGGDVAEQIQQGTGFSGGRKLGGDPLRDVVLAEAVLRRDENATRFFLDEYSPIAMGVARKLSAAHANDNSWWNDLVDKLAGLTEPPGKLESYRGTAGLSGWLSQTVYRHVKNDLKKQRRRLEILEEIGSRRSPSHPRPDTVADRHGCHELLSGMLRTVIADLPVTDRRLLYLLFVEELNGREVAKVLRKAAGNVTRQKQKVYQRLQSGISETMTVDSSQSTQYRECIEMMFGHQRGLDGLVVDFLRALQTEGEVR